MLNLPQCAAFLVKILNSILRWLQVPSVVESKRVGGVIAQPRNMVFCDCDCDCDCDFDCVCVCVCVCVSVSVSVSVYVFSVFCFLSLLSPSSPLSNNLNSNSSHGLEVRFNL